MEMMQRVGIEVSLFDFMKNNTTEEERKAGYDIADYLLKAETKESILSRLIVRNPYLKTLISALDLEVVSVEKYSWISTEKREFQTLTLKVEISLFSGEMLPMVAIINAKKVTENGKEKYDNNPTLGRTIWLAAGTEQTK